MIPCNSVQTNKAGFTLMELMIYMGIVGIVVVIAGEAFSNATKFRVRTDNMIRANQEAENVGTIFKEDVEQLGTKNSLEKKPSVSDSIPFDTALIVSKKVFMDPDNSDDNKKDSSSFTIKKVTNGSKTFSDFTFRRTRYSDEGIFQAIEEIHWYVEDGFLKRTCKVLETAKSYTLPADDPCTGVDDDTNPIEMASGVSKFNVEPASPDTAENYTQMFPTPGSDNKFILFPRRESGGEYDGSDFNRNFVSFNSLNEAGEALGAGNEISLSGFWANYQNKEDDIDDAILAKGSQRVNQAIAINNVDYNISDYDWKTLCIEKGKLSFLPNKVYEISFEVTKQSSGDRSSTFVPDRDHMSVGFRRATGGYVTAKKNSHRVILPDFLFYPPLDNNHGEGAGKRSMRFTVPERVDNVCLAFTFAFYSPLVAQGHVSISDLKVSRVAFANYKFNNFNTELASNIKEKKNVKALKLQLQISRGAKGNGKGETGDVNLIIPIPSNGIRD